MTDDEIKFVILCVADRAWDIASAGNALPEVLLAIESLSDDPEKVTEIIAEVRNPSSFGRERNAA